MSNGRKPPRLWLRDRSSTGRQSMWVIKDGGEQHHTGCGVEDRIGAEKALGDYIAAKWTAPEVGRSDMPISEVLAIYGSEHGVTTADPARIGHTIDALLPFWGDDPVSSIKGEKCRQYNRWRKRAPGTVRRELGTLRAALRYCQTEGYITSAPVIWLPEKPGPRERWLTRDEMAKLLWAIRQEDNRAKHLLRFVLIGLYTGTRKNAILGLSWSLNSLGGHVDLENGVMYRQSASARRTKKRQTPVRIPRRLLYHMRLWKSSSPWVVEYRGGGIKDVKTGWNAARIRAGFPDITPHVLRHTAITWAMQNGARIEDASVFFAISVEELQRTYWHHNPSAQGRVVAALGG